MYLMQRGNRLVEGSLGETFEPTLEFCMKIQRRTGVNGFKVNA